MKVLLAQELTKVNSDVAAGNRRRLASLGVAMVNIIGSPGAGKTKLLEATLSLMAGTIRTGVIEGDVWTSRDGQRIAACGIPVVQLNTQGACHLDAAMVSSALDNLNLTGLDLVAVENVGNLVCPASFDLGETRRVVVLSTAEGDDKPGKYPAVFRGAHAIVVSKVDLIGHTDFRLESFERDLRLVNRTAALFPVSARNGTGLDPWVHWLCGVAKSGRRQSVSQRGR